MAVTLPFDIIISEILTRLPIKTLFRFRCVCKSWRYLVWNPYFVHLHHRHSLSSNSDTDRLLLMFDEHNNLYSFSLDSPQSPAIKLNDVSDHLLTSSSYIVGSCNGLLCISDNSNTIILLNPFTLLYKVIPNADDLLVRGFLYDCKHDDYKIFGYVGHNYSHGNQVMIYSLREDCWKFLRDTATPYLSAENVVVLDNHLCHWLYRIGDNKQWICTCYDIWNDKWSEVPFPDEYLISREYGGYAYLNFGVIDGCLCFLIEDMSDQVEVWVMKQYGVKESWMRLFNDVTASPPIIGSHKGGREILLSKYPYRYNAGLVSYDIADQTANDFEIPGLVEFDSVHMFMQSLINPPGMCYV